MISNVFCFAAVSCEEIEPFGRKMMLFEGKWSSCSFQNFLSTQPTWSRLHQNRIQIFGRNIDTLLFCLQFSFKLKRDQKSLLSPNVLQVAKNGFEADILMRPESRALANVQPGSQPEKLLAILPLSKMKNVSRLSLQSHISGNSLLRFNLMTFESFDFAGWDLVVNRHLFESISW